MYKRQFKDILGDASKWAQWVGKNIIGSVSNAANVLKNGYKEAASKVAPILHSMGLNANDAAKLMKGAGFASDAIAAGLNVAFKGLGLSGMTNALKFAGYGANDVAAGLKYVGFSASNVASVLKNTFKLGDDGVNAALKLVSFSTDDINKGLKSIGASVGGALSHLNPFSW